MSESLIRLLGELPPAEPDAARAERIRMGCRARLARRARRASTARNPAARLRAAHLWQPLTVGLGVAYLAAVIVQAFRLYGRF